MKLNHTLLALLLLLFVACGKKDTTTPIPEPPEKEFPEVPEVPDVDPELEKYGKTILLGTQTYDITKFKKNKLNDNIDLMEVLINAPATEARAEYKLLAHVLRLDKKALLSDYSVEALMAGNNLEVRASPKKIMENQTTAQRKVLAVVNGDFFNMTPGSGSAAAFGNLVTNGAIAKTANGSWTQSFGMTKTNEFFIDDLNYTITIGDDNFAINGINIARGADNLIIYTTSKGEKTGANEYGSEILLKPVSGDWETLTDYENVICEVVSDRPVATAGGLAIPKGHIVLSAHGKAIDIYNKYPKGSKMSIKVSKPKGNSGKIYDVKAAIGMAYPILSKGEVQTVTSTSGNPGGKEPRTSLGYSDKYFYMVVVEGRSDVSKGLTVTELSYLLKHFDATDAVNLDGGGSTLLAVGSDVYGQPAGTTWFRPVPNGFAIVRNN